MELDVLDMDYPLCTHFMPTSSANTEVPPQLPHDPPHQILPPFYMVAEQKQRLQQSPQKERKGTSNKDTTSREETTTSTSHLGFAMQWQHRCSTTLPLRLVHILRSRGGHQRGRRHPGHLTSPLRRRHQGWRSAGLKRGSLNTGTGNLQESGRKTPLSCNAIFSMFLCRFSFAETQLKRSFW